MYLKNKLKYILYIVIFFGNEGVCYCRIAVEKNGIRNIPLFIIDRKCTLMYVFDLKD